MSNYSNPKFQFASGPSCYSQNMPSVCGFNSYSSSYDSCSKASISYRYKSSLSVHQQPSIISYFESSGSVPSGTNISGIMNNQFFINECALRRITIMIYYLLLIFHHIYTT